MYWQEDQEDTTRPVSDSVVDLSFRVNCRTLPLDHAYSLARSVFLHLPWFENEPLAGLHLIHGAESGNGWLRPQGPNALLHLSRRTRLTLRLPAERVTAACALSGRSLNVGGYSIALGQTSTRSLSTLTTLFARYVSIGSPEEEMAFLDRCSEMLELMGIRPKKMLAGRDQTLEFPDAPVSTRSLMIDGITPEESIHLQQQGLGVLRKYGCGLFLPHKGIDAVARPQKNSHQP